MSFMLFFGLAAIVLISIERNNGGQEYCERVSEVNPSLWDRWVNGQSVYLSSYLKFAICNELRENNLLSAECKVKQAWISERHRHQDAQQTIKDLNMAEIMSSFGSQPSRGLMNDSNYLSYLRQNQARELEMACTFSLS